MAQPDRGHTSRARIRQIVRFAVDAVAWQLGMVTALATRYEFGLGTFGLELAISAALLAAAIHATVARLDLLYGGRHRYGSLEEIRALASTVLATSLIVLVLDVVLFRIRPIPASTPFVGGLLALLVMFGVRFLRRRLEDRELRPTAADAAPVLLFGAGSAGHALIRSMLRDPHGRYVPIGLIDDDPDKRNLRLEGVPVLGNQDELGRCIGETSARTVIFAVANADAELVRQVRGRVLAAGVRFQTVPSVSELLDAPLEVSDVRDVNVTDLLGRRQIDTDLDAIAGYLTGKRVLITGAGGSIGSELCRQVHRFRPSELIMLDRDESALHAVQLSLTGMALLDTPDVVLTDLRDAAAVKEIFAAHRPEVVFHAAALKHLPLLQRYPAEAVKTNIQGTLNVLQACGGVQRFVNISTDKAAAPTSVLGYSKRITERLTAFAACVNQGTFLNVRFGNVLGSRGSVLKTFAAQVATGGPITVTHPEVSRYFMTIQEAVQLVIHAAAIGHDGEALVLSMGEPVRIAQVARQMADLGPRPCDIVYTGLRPGEKLHEELFGPDEHDVRPLHPLISHVEVPPLPPTRLAAISAMAATASQDEQAQAKLVTDLRDVCADGLRRAPAYQPETVEAGMSAQPVR